MSTAITKIQAKQPDISYHPDFTKYQLRTERIKSQLPANIGLPPRFPKQLTGPLVWEGEDFVDERAWTFVLSELHITEINQALFYFKCTVLRTSVLRYLLTFV